MNCKYILAHDIGTSGNKSVLYGIDGCLYASSFYEYKTYYLANNWVEQDPEDWWKAVCISTKDLIEKAGISKKDILCVCFSAQMMGCLPVDGRGNPLRKAIIWADSRSAEQSRLIENAIGMTQVYKITGHRVSASYSAAKILWLKYNQPDIFSKTYKFLQAKDFIVHKLTNEFVTDFSDASGTNLLDLKKREWSNEILDGIGLNEGLLPVLCASTDVVGKVTRTAAGEIELLEGTPVVIGGGDGSCAAVGAGVVEKGSAYNVMGSSSWIAVAVEEPIFDPKMRTFNWVHLDKNLFSPCGTMQSAGYSYRWLKEILYDLEVLQAKQQNVDIYEIIEKKIEAAKPGSENLLFLPYLLGERSPKWNPDAKGAFVGLKISTTQENMFRSVLEGVAFNLKIILDVFSSIVSIDDVIITGGGVKSKVWRQILADIWQKPVLVPQFLEESTSIGAAICGGVGIGVFEDFKVAKKFNKIVDEVKPRDEFKEMYNNLYEIFNETYKALVPIYSSLANIE